VVDAHVERSIHDDPSDRLLTAGLGHRSVVGEIVAGCRQQLVHRQVAYRCFLT